MGTRYLRQFISFVICFGMLNGPIPSFGKSKVISTSAGTYAILQNINPSNRQFSQIIMGPKSRSTRLDSNGDGQWDHWELTQDNITVTADSPIQGHFARLNYRFQTPKGILYTEFIYEERTRSYVLIGKSFEAYRVMKSESIVIGTCSKQNRISRLAQEWNQIYSKLGGHQDLIEWIKKDENNHFIDQSCRQGSFSASLPSIQEGIAQVFASSARTTSKKGGRFLQCMDQTGLGVHADRIRAFLYQQVDPQKASALYNVNAMGPSLPLAGMSNIDKGSNPIDVVNATRDAVEQTVATTENSDDALTAQIDEDKRAGRRINLPLVRCEYRPLTANGTQRAEWNQNEGQITLNRLVGDQLPSHYPAYGGKVIDALLPETRVDADDYAKAFFHELVHSSFIENESFSESIENCCGSPDGYNLKNPACEAMQRHIERSSGQQSFIYAINQKNPQAYSNYHQSLIRAMDNSINDANNLEGNVISRFKMKTDQCDSRGQCDKTLERVLLDSKEECSKKAKSQEAKDLCLKQFNDSFYKKMHALYEEECSRFNSPRLSLDCKNLATAFMNVFGDCVDHSTVSQINPPWHLLIRLLIGNNSSATDLRKCECFDITHSSYNHDSSRTENHSSTNAAHGQRLTDGINEDGFNTESMHQGINTFNQPGANARNYDKLSQRPVKTEMLQAMRAVPNEQITQEFTQGYERRATVVLDSALGVFKNVKDQLLPSAHAQAKVNSSETTLNYRLRTAPKGSAAIDSPGNNPPLKIRDPFQNQMPPLAPLSDKVKSLSQQGWLQQNAKTTTAQTSHLQKPRSEVSRPITLQKTRAQQSSPKVTASTVQPPSLQNKPSRRDPASRTHLAVSPGQRPATVKESPQYIFHSTNELLKFLMGPYERVNEALLQPEFLKILIDHKVKIIEHEGRIKGSRKPAYILEFNPAKGNLQIVQWE